MFLYTKIIVSIYKNYRWNVAESKQIVFGIFAAHVPMNVLPLSDLVEYYFRRSFLDVFRDLKSAFLGIKRIYWHFVSESVWCSSILIFCNFISLF